ncbi:MAG: transglutaminase-like domain-containing protein [Phycisphaerales bacterium]
MAHRFFNSLLLLAILGGAAVAQQPAWTPLITPGDERLWMLRWEFAASRQNLNEFYDNNPPILRPDPYQFPRFWPNPGNRGFTTLGTTQSIDVRSAVFVAPLQWRTASSEAHPEFLSGTLDFNGARVTDQWIGQPGDLPDVINVEWFVQVADDNGRAFVKPTNTPERVDVDFRLPVVVHETVFNEPAAMEIDWPAEWPRWTQPLRDPQAFIDANDRYVGSLLNEWTNNNPRAMRPAELAKYLASRVIEEAQPGTSASAYWPIPDENSGYPFVVTRNTVYPPLRGFDVQDERIYLNDRVYKPRLRQTIEAAQANAAVITNLYVALLRAAQIPARVIVAASPSKPELDRVPGHDVLTHDYDPDGRITTFRFWAEFYLWDEQAQRGEWIPVDVVRQRAESSRPPPLDRPWRFFGNHDELDELVPMTSLYVPAQARRFGSVPGVWGWRPDPADPGFNLDQVIRFEVISAPRRADDPFADIGVKRGD